MNANTTAIEIWNGIIFNFYMGLSHNNLNETTYVALVALERLFLELKFLKLSKDYAKYVDVVCNINRQTYEISRGFSV